MGITDFITCLSTANHPENKNYIAIFFIVDIIKIRFMLIWQAMEAIMTLHKFGTHSLIAPCEEFFSKTSFIETCKYKKRVSCYVL